MRNPKGYVTITHPDHKLKECDAFTCFHHGGIVHVPPGKSAEDAGARCKRCMQLVCQKCGADDICFPFAKRLEMWELHHTIRKTQARAEALRSYGLPY